MVPPLSEEIHAKTPWWMPETMESTESYAGYVSSYVYIPVMKFTLEIRHRDEQQLVVK